MKINEEEILEYHLGGKIGLDIIKNLSTQKDLIMAYTPGVAIPVKKIFGDPKAAFIYTCKSNTVGIVTDGSAVLGLGDVGPLASIPVMEGKAILFKAFGDINAWPIPLYGCRKYGDKGPTDIEKFIEMTKAISVLYGGINIEDVAAPACFEIEDRLIEALDIPVFHDDQWGTAIITLAGVKNYCLLSSKKMEDLKIVINGAGAAGIRIADMLKESGVKNIVMCDSKGVITHDRDDLNTYKRKHAVENKNLFTLYDAIKDADIFIGVSVADCLKPEDIKKMNRLPGIFAMANPDPEIKPEIVEKTLGKGNFIMATGRSDYPNQINNVLGFPFIFSGALAVHAKKINMQMKKAASEALAEIAKTPSKDFLSRIYDESELEFGYNHIIPKPFEPKLFTEVSFAVAKAAVESKIVSEVNLESLRNFLQEKNKKRMEWLERLCSKHSKHN